MLRLILLLASVAGVLVPLVIIHQDTDAWPLLGIAGLFLLNVIYLLETHPRKAQWRIVKLTRLWLDAKETELKKRASPPADSPHT